MSVKNKLKQQDTGLLQGANAAKSEIDQRGSAITSKAAVGNLVSMESLDSTNRAGLVASLEQAENVIDNSFGEMLSVENFEDPMVKNTAEAQRLRNVALESGAIASMALADPAAYARIALSTESTAPQGGRLIAPMGDGVAGSLGYTATVANEAYDEAELNKFAAHSIAFNTFAARQDGFGEAFYPTIVISADQGGADLSVRRQRVFDNGRHALSGKPTDFGFKNLLSAAVDSTILADQSTRLVPYRDPTVASPEFLLNSDQFGEKAVIVAGVDVPSAPFQFGKAIDLIGVSGYAPLLGAGVLDHSDAVAARATLASVYLSGGEDAPVIQFPTAGLHRSSFVGSIEGRDRQMTLTFAYEGIVINGDTRAVDGSVVAALAPIASNNLVVYARAMFTGTLDTQFGTVELNASRLTVLSITDVNGDAIDMTTGAGAAARAAVEGLAFEGYDLLAFRTNSNRRTPGKRLDIETVRERYTVLVGPPISVQRPATADGEAAEMEALINAVRLRNSNNAVTALENYADLLKSVVRGPKQARVADIAGLGRVLVKPFYEELTLDMSQSMNSIRSGERAEDISSTIVQAIRDLSYRMYQFSEIQAALDSQNATGNESPVLLIGTDQILVRHLMVQGDTRTFGTQFPEARVVVSQDDRIRDTIYVTLTRSKNLDQLDALRFGSHLWIPELVSRMPVHRDGGTHMEAMVQPRTLHVNHLPVLGKITVTNMPKALVDKTATPALATDTSNPYLGGIVFQ